MKRRSAKSSGRDQSAEPIIDSQSDPSLPAGTPSHGELPHEEIALLAYSYWESRQGEEGSAEEDWLRAERELQSKRVQVKTAGSAAGFAGA